MSHSYVKYIPLKVASSIIRAIVYFTGQGPIRYDEKFKIPTRDNKRTIIINVYIPQAATTPSPVVLNWHGSGYVVPMHGSDDLYCRTLADETGYIVLDASYALAPEWPFPYALNDVEDLILYVSDKPERYKVDEIVLSGFSAGGSLALVVSSNPISEVRRDHIRAIIVFYPSTDLAAPAKDKRAPDGSPGMLNPTAINILNACYVAGDTDVKDPRISVIYADPKEFPQDLLIVTAEKDNIALEAELFGRKLQENGKQVTIKRILGVDHDWDKSCKEGDEASKRRDEAYALAAQFLKQLTHEENGRSVKSRI